MELNHKHLGAIDVVPSAERLLRTQCHIYSDDHNDDVDDDGDADGWVIMALCSFVAHVRVVCIFIELSLATISSSCGRSAPRKRSNLR